VHRISFFFLPSGFSPSKIPSLLPRWLFSERLFFYRASRGTILFQEWPLSCPPPVDTAIFFLGRRFPPSSLPSPPWGTAEHSAISLSPPPLEFSVKSLTPEGSRAPFFFPAANLFPFPGRLDPSLSVAPIFFFHASERRPPSPPLGGLFSAPSFFFLCEPVFWTVECPLLPPRPARARSIFISFRGFLSFPSVP